MRRYQSLGLLRKSHNRANKNRNQEGIARFVSESQVKDLILYRRLARARPALRSLEFANDDVDWQLEYYCEAIGKWIMRALGWILWLIQQLARFIHPGLNLGKKSEDIPSNKNADNDDDDDSRRVRRLNKMASDIRGRKQWRYDQCRPFHNRRFIKRKWFLNPGTQKWAMETVKLYHRHVSRGFRSLCSGIGKDTRIYVVDPISPAPRNTFVFKAESKILSSQSELFKWWFEESGDMKEIETGFVTPDEMEAILVYVYTLTWPVGMMIPRTSDKIDGNNNKYKRKRLDRRFSEILELYGMSLKLTRESPYNSQLSYMSSPKILPKYGQAVSQEDILCDSFYHPTLQFIFPFDEIGLAGQGDFHFVRELPLLSLHKNPGNEEKVEPPSNRSEDNSNVKGLFQRLSFPFTRRIHPETMLSVGKIKILTKP